MTRPSAISVDAQDRARGEVRVGFFPHEYASQYRADEEAVLASGRPLINHEELAPAITGDTHWFSTTKYRRGTRADASSGSSA